MRNYIFLQIKRFRVINFCGVGMQLDVEDTPLSALKTRLKFKIMLTRNRNSIRIIILFIDY